MSIRVGVAILRRAGCLAVLKEEAGRRSLLFQASLPRTAGTSPAATLEALLQSLPGDLARAPVHAALSPADLACSDAWFMPPGTSEAHVSRMAPTMCEARCAGESLETLAVDALASGNRIRAVAGDLDIADRIRAAAPGRAIELISGVPIVLAATLGPGQWTLGAERIEVDDESWRSRPCDGPEDAGLVRFEDLEFPVSVAPAVAAARVDPDEVPNLVRTTRQGRNTVARRYGSVLMNLAAAVTLCLGAIAVRSHLESVRDGQEIEAARRAEMELWSRFLPSEEPREGRLLRAMKERLSSLGEGPDGASFPSALSFWGEIGRHMPNPDAVGLTLDSLDLAPDGGRLNGRVPAAGTDPLRNASQIEGKLNQSKKVTARGDYEVRDGQVQVRLRMDYRP